MHDRLLLILSEHSMSSEWVKTEIAKARKREMKEGKRVLFPVRLVGFERLRDWECFDGDTGKDSAREIREYFIPDFSNWKDHDSYQTAFQRLVSDLKAEAITPLRFLRRWSWECGNAECALRMTVPSRLPQWPHPRGICFGMHGLGSPQPRENPQKRLSSAVHMAPVRVE